MAVLMGDHARAGNAFASARDELARSGQQPLLAITDLDEARACVVEASPAATTGARALLDRAERAFRDLGMRRHLDQTGLIRAALEAPAQRRGRAGLPAGLTERELDILRLVARGYSDRRISKELFVSPRTVHTHLRNMLTKTELSNRTELSVWAVEQGLVPR
jgi:DNA-binding NarL/FixJ family response regulator